MKKFYAVKKGHTIGIFYNWNDCKKQIEDFSGALYKGFSSLEEAHDFITSNKYTSKKSIDKTKEISLDTLKDDEMIAYVDGSYNIASKSYGSGVVIFFKGKKTTFSINGNDKELTSMRNVAGEIVAAQKSMEYALENGATTLYIYYDYEGIEKWSLGIWKANKVGTQQYKKFFDTISKNLNVEFIKVKAHSNDEFNDEADNLAKKAIGIY